MDQTLSNGRTKNSNQRVVISSLILLRYWDDPSL